MKKKFTQYTFYIFKKNGNLEENVTIDIHGSYSILKNILPLFSVSVDVSVITILVMTFGRTNS